MKEWRWGQLAVFFAALGVFYGFVSQELTPGQLYDDRFRLFTGCEPVRIGYVTIQDEEGDLDLSAERVETAVRSRLRGARIYYSGPTTAEAAREMAGENPLREGLFRLRLEKAPILGVYVNVVGQAFNLDVRMLQEVYNTNVDRDGLATTWSASVTGTHRQTSSFVLGTVSEVMDNFIDEYLRVNEEACGQR